MRLTATSILIAAVASVFCNSHAALVVNVKDGNQHLQSPHIVGGKPLTYLTRPNVFDLNLYKKDKFIRSCKAVELAAQNVYRMWLTAAECLDQNKYDKVDIITYQYRLEKFSTMSYNLKFIVYHIHPDYNNRTKEHNIALMSPLFEHSGTDPKLRRVELANSGGNFLHKTADVFLEWKNQTNEPDAKQSYTPYSIETTVIRPIWCTLFYPFSSTRSNHVCASGWSGKGLNQTDIGIPLVFKENDDTYKLLGIATTVRPWTRRFGLPIEFLSITPYLEWIKSF